MAVVADLPRRREVSFVLSAAQARAMLERAQREWGADVDDPSTMHLAVVRLYMGGHNQYAGQRHRRPVGAFHLRWHTPTSDQATIERLEWDPELGGSDEEVCQVIDALAGWRLSR
jgi:hypothetical protein